MDDSELEEIDDSELDETDDSEFDEIDDSDDEQNSNGYEENNESSKKNNHYSSKKNKSLSTKINASALNVTNNKLLNKNNHSSLPNKGSASKDSSIASKLRNRKKPLNFLNRNKNNNDSTSNDSNNNDNNTDNDSSDSAGNEFIEGVRKIRRIIPAIISAIVSFIFIAIVVFFVIIVMMIVSIFSGSDFSNLDSNVLVDEDSEYYEEANLYYEKLNEAADMYADSCGIYLNRSYIHATLTYINNVSQYDNEPGARYQLMADNADDVAKLMVNNCNVDYGIGGIFYNNLLKSSFLQNYYKDILSYMDAKTLVDNIFEYAEDSILIANLSSGYISNNLRVTMGTCEQPYNKKLLNEGNKYSSNIGFSDYIMGVIMGEVEEAIKKENKEFLKAFTIVASSYALSRAEYKTGDSEIWVHNGNCWQLSCDIKDGCTYCYDLGEYGTTFTGNQKCDKLGYRKDSMTSEQRQILDEVFEEVFGTVMLTNNNDIKEPSYRDKSSTCGNKECLGQEDAIRDARNGMDYQSILEKYYDNFILSNMREDSYVSDVTYGDGGYSNEVVYYDQTDYKNKFCGLSNQTISSSGCGVTSMAMILSTFVDSSYTPVRVMEEAYGGKYCGSGISGTSVDFFRFSAQKHNLDYQGVGKKGDMQVVLDALKSGNSLVVAHMGQGTFTNSGHYIVLTKVNEKGQVYVLDSYNSRRTGWHDFNSVIVKQLKSYGKFHIITKR